MGFLLCRLSFSFFDILDFLFLLADNLELLFFFNYVLVSSSLTLSRLLFTIHLFISIFPTRFFAICSLHSLVRFLGTLLLLGLLLNPVIPSEANEGVAEGAEGSLLRSE